MNDEEYDRVVKDIERAEKMRKLAKKHGGKVVVDNGRAIIHLNAFSYMTEDGTVIYEF